MIADQQSDPFKITEATKPAASSGDDSWHRQIITLEGAFVSRA